MEHPQAWIVPEGMLDPAILQGMKAEYHDSAPGSKHRRDSSQCRLQGSELVVDCDSQCLEGARGGMNFLGAVGWVDVTDEPGKVDGAFEGLLGAEFHDRGGDSSA